MSGWREPVNTVIVVGAGPVGLMLAAELRLGGADVVVLERRAAPTTESRASTLHARTVEIFDSRGLLDRLGEPPVEQRGHFGGIGFDLTQWKVPQTRTERLLGEWAAELGADVRRGHEVRALSVVDDQVQVETTGPNGPVSVRGRYLVACDGERSTVRRLTGAEFPGLDARRELLRADVAGIRVPNRRFERLPGGLAIAARRADGVTRVMVHEFGSEPRGAEPTFDDVADAWKRVTGEDIQAGKPLWWGAFDDANRLLTGYRHGRILFAGDAAHRQLPAGGQALNLGLQDAVNLGWKLALVARGAAPEELLDSYHAERHAVARRVLANIRAQAWLLLGGPEVEPVRAIIGELIALDEVRTHLAAMISGLDIRYDVGEGEHPLLGLRMPNLRLTTVDGSTNTADLLRRGRGVLLDLSADGAALGALAGPWADRMDVVAATPGEALPGAGSVLIRPDGHIAWIGPAPGGPESALRRWFGPGGAA